MQAQAIQRVIMKRVLRLKGINTAANIKQAELEHLYFITTGQPIPDIKAIEAELASKVKPNDIIAKYMKP